MKKAEEYWNEFTKNLTGFNKLAYDVHKPVLLERIRTIQLDAIEYAVNKCAENATIESIIHPSEGYVFGIVDQKSILKTIDQIKEEMK
jgi:hypothetical protein